MKKTLTNSHLRRLIREEYQSYQKPPSSKRSLVNILFEKSKTDTNKKSDSEVQKILSDEMPELKDGPAAMREFLNGPGSDPKVRAFLLKGKEDGAEADEKAPYKDTGKKVGDLVPTQSEIEFMNSVSFPLATPGAFSQTMKGGTVKVGPPGNDHIVTCGNLIIDGHHRWSSFMSTAGPDGVIAAYDLQIKGKTAPELLAIAQIAIAATKPGKVPTATAGEKNILGKGKDEIKKMIIDNIGKPNEKGKEILSTEVVEGIVVDDNVVKKIGLDKGVTDKFLESDGKDKEAKKQICLKVADFMSDNLSKMNQPAAGAPPRIDMPQFDQAGGGVEGALSTLDQGEINFQEPFTTKSESIRKKDSAIMERWQRLAGILKD